MVEILIEPVSYRSTFAANMWRESAVEAAVQLETDLGLAVPRQPNRFTEDEGKIAACLSPGRYLVLAENSQIFLKVAQSCDAGLISLVQLDHSREAFRLSGKQAARLLMKGVAIDLDESAFPVGSLFQSSIHDIGVIALRREASSFDLLVYKSFGVSFHHWLQDAAMEFS
ncbi:sarcosine oxidase subunit gamma family protein [uncultured Erythrobacter sp.]|uniref:sarcosine oxidase subunit gamma n=1 Tax=uncultured Erythrobacter sp. TaxID=263913 RepID=UPI00262FB2A2|nr:sarcosine oxidase subunit gamma family protein [uncultured Erythrobacter sp.]